MAEGKDSELSRVVVEVCNNGVSFPLDFSSLDTCVLQICKLESALGRPVSNPRLVSVLEKPLSLLRCLVSEFCRIVLEAGWLG